MRARIVIFYNRYFSIRHHRYRMPFSAFYVINLAYFHRNLLHIGSYVQSGHALQKNKYLIGFDMSFSFTKIFFPKSLAKICDGDTPSPVRYQRIISLAVKLFNLKCHLEYRLKFLSNSQSQTTSPLHHIRQESTVLRP